MKRMGEGKVTTYIITWNPSRWAWKPDEYDRQVEATEKGELFPYEWSCGNTKSIAEGDRVFLFRQESDRGLIGSGDVTKGSFSDDHWNPARAKTGDKALYVRYGSDVLLPTEKRLLVEYLIAANLGVPWHRMVASGMSVPVESADRLEDLWQKHLRAIGWGKKPGRGMRGSQQEAVLAAMEGDSYRGEATFRHRNGALIEKKKKLSDGRCSVCQVKFSERYEGIEALCLVAHHVEPIGKRKKASKTTLDDIDLLCPNCHTAVHTKDPPLSADKLRKMLVG